MPADAVGPTVRVDVLGPLRLAIDDKPIDVPGPKRRAVLAVLALASGRVVTADHLVDALWPTSPPDSGRAALHSHVSRLRGHLGPSAGRLVSVDGGYRLVLDPGGLDLERAEGLFAEGRTNRTSDPAAAAGVLREALALWRGPALADLRDVPALATRAEGMEQLRRELTDLLIRCALDAGQAEDVVRLAAEAFADDPLREPAVLLLMHALAVSGQAPRALATAREYRRRLADETGLDPSAQLGDLERSVALGTIGPLDAGATDPSPPTGGTRTPRATRLIGRSAELTALQRLLDNERLVTIVGAGGVGKTALALELARQEDATTVLSLAALADPTGVPHVLAGALGLREVRGDVLAACLMVLRGLPRHLLVIDNCEHQLDAVRDLVSAVLDACPEVRVLATSREPLGLAAECPSRLAPLPLPGPSPLSDRDADQLANVPSVAVFLERATRVRGELTAGVDDLRLVGEIVRQLDGVPLAIELAAGRLSTFSLADLSRRLDRALDLLGGGRPRAENRHRTLRSTVEWSYDLLTSEEQRLFRQLSVFTDGVDLATAEYVAAELGLAGDPGRALARLVDASMMDATFEGRTRYRMLETIRAFGVDRLAAAGEDADAADRMVRWAVELMTWIDKTRRTEREPDADAALRREVPNLRTAWHLARRQPRVDQSVALVIALCDVTSWRDLAETWDWAEQLVGDAALVGHPRSAEVLGCAANAAYLRGDYIRGEQLASIGIEQASGAEGSWRCLSSLALAELSRGAYGAAAEHALAAAPLAVDPSENLGIAGLALAYAGALDQARAARDRMSDAAASPTMLGFAAYVGGEIDNLAGHPDRAEAHYERSIDLARSSGASFLVAIAAVGLLTVRVDGGHIREALYGYRDLIDYWERSGNWTQQWVTLRNLAQLLRQLGDEEPAALLDAAAKNSPDAPAAHPTPPTERQFPILPRTDALKAARDAIERNLDTS